MKRITYISALLFTLSAGATLQAVEGFKVPAAPSFSRYQGILERMPFGAAPAANTTATLAPIDAKNAAQELKDQQLLARQINMSCVNTTPAGKIAVGFTDMAAKPPVSYYLLVGDSSNGWLVKSADYDEEWAELEKDGIAIYVKLGQGLMSEPPVKAPLPQSESIKLATGANKPPTDASTEQVKKDGPLFKTLTEQMISIATPAAPGALVPPLPNVALDDQDVMKAMEAQHELKDEDSDQMLAAKLAVEGEKEKMAEHIVNEGGSANSYLHRLRRRQLEEQLLEKQAQLEKEKELSSFAKKAVEDVIKNREIMLLEETLREEAALEDAADKAVK